MDENQMRDTHVNLLNKIFEQTDQCLNYTEFSIEYLEN